MSKVFNDTEIEPKLTLLSREELQDTTSNNSNKAIVDIRNWGFWEKGQQALFDLWVFDPNACHYRNKSLQRCYARNEQENRRAYNERILQIEHGIFKPLLFSINGSMGRECQNICLCLAQMNLKRETFRNHFK